jgi:hypothetical protein
MVLREPSSVLSDEGIDAFVSLGRVCGGVKPHPKLVRADRDDECKRSRPHEYDLRRKTDRTRSTFALRLSA